MPQQFWGQDAWSRVALPWCRGSFVPLPSDSINTWRKGRKSGVRSSDVRSSGVPKGESVKTHASANRLKRLACRLIGRSAVAHWRRLGDLEVQGLRPSPKRHHLPPPVGPNPMHA